MRLKNRAFILVLAMAAAGLLAPASSARANTSVSVSFFYDSLAPYGEWITVSNYGRCWRPARVSAGWQPYLHGEWNYTDLGWTWVSFDPWGGDPYHYGTWVYTVRYGWLWIPGTVWAPAWVTWYITDDYCGWAPVPPSFVVGSSGYAGRPVTVSRSAYVFVPVRQFVGVDASAVRVPAVQNAALAARARPLTRFEVRSGVLSTSGPPVSHVERVAGRQIPRVSLGQARAQAVPFRAPRHEGRGRASVVLPATERAKAIRSPSRQATQQISRTKPYEARPERAVRQAPSHPMRERSVQSRPLPPAKREHPRSVRSAPPPQPKGRIELARTQSRLELRRAEGNAGGHVQTAPRARVERPRSPQPNPQGQPHGRGNAPGREKDKEHRRND